MSSGGVTQNQACDLTFISIVINIFEEEGSALVAKL